MARISSFFESWTLHFLRPLLKKRCYILHVKNLPAKGNTWMTCLFREVGKWNRKRKSHYCASGYKMILPGAQKQSSLGMDEMQVEAQDLSASSSSGGQRATHSSLWVFTPFLGLWSIEDVIHPAWFLERHPVIACWMSLIKLLKSSVFLCLYKMVWMSTKNVVWWIAVSSLLQAAVGTIYVVNSATALYPPPPNAGHEHTTLLLKLWDSRHSSLFLAFPASSMTLFALNQTFESLYSSTQRGTFLFTFDLWNHNILQLMTSLLS